MYWQVGIKFVQFQKNISYHSGIKRTPYKAMFGVEAKVGLTSSSLPEPFVFPQITCTVLLHFEHE
jgi:hypothetical protein